MRKPHWLWTTLALATLATAGCSDDDEGGTKEDGGVEEDGGKQDSGSAEGGPGGECDLSGAGKEKKTLSSDIDENMTLTSDTVWTLDGPIHVLDGVTLTIEPCTRIEGSSSPGSLIVSRGGKIMAVGTADEPILFTSRAPEGDRLPGDWGGVVLLGKAPSFKGDDVQIEGLDDLDVNKYGGSVPNDNSGKMSYVRIEFGGFELMAGSEINGLTMGGVGSKTEIDHIMVNTTRDDCFEWFGGTVSASYLICNGVGDDMFDADEGFTGTLEYLLGRLIPGVVSSGDPNGFEMDGDATNMRAPATNLTARHATLCGGNEVLTGAASFGMVLRENLLGKMDDIVVTGFDMGVDVRDDFGTPASPNVTLSNAKFFGNLDEDIGDNEVFDEVMWFDMGTGNEIPDPVLYDADDCIAADGPTQDVVDSGVGAFSGDDWNLDGLWVDWSTK